jgi:hypothetical protein
MTENDLAAALGFTWDRSAVSTWERTASTASVFPQPGAGIQHRDDRLLLAEGRNSDVPVPGLLLGGCPVTEPELWTTADAAEYLGASSAGSGRKTLSRLGVAPVSREPGRGGQNLYDAVKSVRPKRGCLGEENDLWMRNTGKRSGCGIAQCPGRLAGALRASTRFMHVLRQYGWHTTCSVAQDNRCPVSAINQVRR